MSERNRYRNLTDREWDYVVDRFREDHIDDAYLDRETGLLIITDLTAGVRWRHAAPASFLKGEYK